jgi:hypothetical protein
MSCEANFGSIDRLTKYCGSIAALSVFDKSQRPIRGVTRAIPGRQKTVLNLSTIR